MQWNAKWITTSTDMGEICPVFKKEFTCAKEIASAKLAMTAMGTYEAILNGERISDYVLAPGQTTYHARLQVQEYDVTAMVKENNALNITLGKGWYRSSMVGVEGTRLSWIWTEKAENLKGLPGGITAELTLTYADGTTEIISTDESWQAAAGPVLYSDIYGGEIFDATVEPADWEAVKTYEGPNETLIPQQGEKIIEQERIPAARVFTTPKGEVIVDFGQEVTGYVEITVDAKAGDVVDFVHGEVLDKFGNFYNENYRAAKTTYRYTCKDGVQTHKPVLTFYGFRLIRINEFPGGAENAKPENFTAIQVNSDIKRTGHLATSDPTLNRLFENIIWGQKCNFLDVPTDCPQRDERLGWTGDAQIFVRTASYNYDVEKFFTKWLADLAADQKENGMVGHIIPDMLPTKNGSAAWGDASTICPWQIYLTYGNPAILAQQFESMKKWVSYITTTTTTENMWTGGSHFDDWLGLDAPSGTYKGSTRSDFIATAFYANSVNLVIKAGKVLGEDVAEYEALYERIVAAFREAFPTCTTQTECCLAITFNLAADCQAVADQLAEMVKECGHLKTGFVGAPYLLRSLSDHGHFDLAYELLLRKEYPGWLYQVTKGATTMWEHWDGIMENGDFWSADMNSYNHYAYGAVADWVYSDAAGINTVEEAPGFEKILIRPVPDSRIDWLEASIETRHGYVSSRWSKQENMWRYEIETPVDAHIIIAGREYDVKKGRYLFFSELA